MNKKKYPTKFKKCSWSFCVFSLNSCHHISLCLQTAVLPGVVSVMLPDSPFLPISRFIPSRFSLGTSAHPHPPPFLLWQSYSWLAWSLLLTLTLWQSYSVTWVLILWVCVTAGVHMVCPPSPPHLSLLSSVLCAGVYVSMQMSVWLLVCGLEP